MNQTTRRTGAILAALLLLVSLSDLHAAEPIAAFTPNARFLFQGDSITDGNRGRSADPNHILGHGYVFIIATKHGAALVRFQRVFDDDAKRAPADYWIWDRVHPTYRGHQLMADEWERVVRAFWK